MDGDCVYYVDNSVDNWLGTHADGQTGEKGKPEMERTLCQDLPEP